MAKLDLTNQVFGRLTALCVDHVVYKEPRSLGSTVFWRCRCLCGNEVVVRTTDLRRGATQSCGCLQIERAKAANTKHNLGKSSLYDVWTHIKQRCLNQQSKDYPFYGGRGITVCNSWKDDFTNFYNWAIENGYKKGLSIDRIDNDKGYSPENCRWVDRFVQANNTRRNTYLTYKGESKTVSEWARLLGVSRVLLRDRLCKLGWPIEKVIETPVNKKVKGAG